MARSRSRLKDFAAYLVVRLGVALIQALTDGAARLLAEAFGWSVYLADARHRRVADDNLRCAFPDLSADRRARLVRESFFHFTGLIIEIMRLPRKLHVNNWRRRVEMVGGDKLTAAMTSDRPALLVTGHFGNWELAGYTTGLLGFRCHAIARPLDNPYLDQFVRRWREAAGQRVLAKKGDFERMEDLLRERGVLATLADQDAGPRGLFVDFFGRPASTHKAIALLALEFDVPLVVIGVPRVSKSPGFEVQVEEVIEPAEFANLPNAVAALTQRFTSALERLIRRHPGQYFWMHRRWKHQPAVRKRAAGVGPRNASLNGKSAQTFAVSQTA
jgi:Kdo2-lipid IVA lauroyltransferase/acyltransferase